MKRRQFLRVTSTYTGGLLMLPSFLTAGSLFDADSLTKNTGNRLIFIQLNGGNDGLNTWIPFDNPAYYANRPTLGIGKDKVINKTQGMGFHPNLKDLATMAQEGQLTVIQNVGYPNPKRSHFRSQEIWQTASDTNEYLSHGWLGRFLDVQCHDDYLAAINIDGVDNLALRSESITSLTLKDPKKIKQLTENYNGMSLSQNPQLDFARKIAYSSSEGMVEIKKALNNSTAITPTYANNPLAQNLRWMSQLIKSDLNSKVFYTSLNGFDTHNNQAGKHSKQLTFLNDALWSLYTDLKDSQLLETTTVIVFSEFGRRVRENGSGTDHGTAGPMFIIGGKNKGNVLGKNPNLTTLDAGDLIHEIDFRSVYASLLQNKFAFNAKDIGIEQEALIGLF